MIYFTYDSNLPRQQSTIHLLVGTRDVPVIKSLLRRGATRIGSMSYLWGLRATSIPELIADFPPSASFWIAEISDFHIRNPV